MSEKDNGWKQPEIKVPEAELEDSFAGFFSEEEEIVASEKGKKRRKKKSGPDILAVSEETDPGFVITEVVALDTGDEIVPVKEEAEEPEKTEETEVEHEESDEAEKADANAEKEDSENSEDKDIEVDLLEEKSENKKKILFPNAKKYISKKRKHQYAATIGAVLIGLAIIGTISLCSALVSLGARVLDNTRQKEAFEWKVYPLLMFDPAAFEDPNQLEEVFILKTALWSTLLENRTKYEYDEQGMLLVPASDLDVAAKSLYGDGVALKHQTIAEGYDFFYLYNEETKTYSVPIMGQTASYVPEVVQINKNGNIYTLIVGYVAPTTLWNVSADGSSESVPDKYLYYDLEKTESGNFIIKAVRRIPADELPEDLEVSDMQSLNETQYFDYDEIQQDYMEQEMEEGGNEASSEENGSEETSSEESSSAAESGESSSSENE